MNRNLRTLLAAACCCCMATSASAATTAYGYILNAKDGKRGSSRILGAFVKMREGRC